MFRYRYQALARILATFLAKVERRTPFQGTERRGEVRSEKALGALSNCQGGPLGTPVTRYAAGVMRCVLLCCVVFAIYRPPGALGTDAWNAGLLFDRFDLTLGLGHRTEALGPFFYSEEQDTQRTWAVPPLFSHTEDPTTESEEFDFAYPLLTYDRFGQQYRWQLGQLLSFAGGPTQQEEVRDRFTLFPVYFHQRSSLPSENYTAVIPFYGHVKHRLFRDEILFVMFPIYIESRKADVVTRNYLYPLFHQRQGEALRGWQFWPLTGREHKDVTTRTNGFNEVQTIGGHDKFFLFWPLFFNEKAGIGTDNPQWMQAAIPAYSLLRSPQRDSTTVLWPLFSRIDDREKKYREWEMPWPLVVMARGEGKTTTRVLPFFSRAHSLEIQRDAYIWPVYKHERVHAEPLDHERTRICFYIYSDVRERNTATGSARRRVDFWPFCLYRCDLNGNRRLQVLALLESFLPNNKSIERDYCPVWSLWRSEKNPRTGAASQSLLWNLYRRETAPASGKCSLLFGLFQAQSGPTGNRVRLFYIPLSKQRDAALSSASSP
jgi:hypothetical protein